MWEALTAINCSVSSVHGRDVYVLVSPRASCNAVYDPFFRCAASGALRGFAEGRQAAGGGRIREAALQRHGGAPRLHGARVWRGGGLERQTRQRGGCAECIECDEGSGRAPLSAGAGLPWRFWQRLEPLLPALSEPGSTMLPCKLVQKNSSAAVCDVFCPLLVPGAVLLLHKTLISFPLSC